MIVALVCLTVAAIGQEGQRPPDFDYWQPEWMTRHLWEPGRMPNQERGGIDGDCIERVGVDHDRDVRFGCDPARRRLCTLVATEPRTHDHGAVATHLLQHVISSILGERAERRRRQRAGDELSSRDRRGRANPGNRAHDHAGSTAQRRLAREHGCADHPP